MQMKGYKSGQLKIFELNSKEIRKAFVVDIKEDKIKVLVFLDEIVLFFFWISFESDFFIINKL